MSLSKHSNDLTGDEEVDLKSTEFEAPRGDRVVAFLFRTPPRHVIPRSVCVLSQGRSSGLLQVQARRYRCRVLQRRAPETRQSLSSSCAQTGMAHEVLLLRRYADSDTAVDVGDAQARLRTDPRAPLLPSNLAIRVGLPPPELSQ